MKIKLLVLCLPFLIFSNQARAEVKTVKYVDVSRYLGRWYQIARKVLPFEPQDCVCAQQTLSVLQNGNVGVYNSCNVSTPSGKLREIRGQAINDDPTSNSKFSVDFNLPYKGKYWVIALAEDYQWAVVSDPYSFSLYILSKTPSLDPALYLKAVSEAAKQMDVKKLKITAQVGCSYPK